MRKYRIIEIDNHFYPQEKRWLQWVYLDNIIPCFTWNNDRDYHSMCNSKADAEIVIERRIKYLSPKKEVIHEYKQQQDEKIK